MGNEIDNKVPYAKISVSAALNTLVLYKNYSIL